MIRLIQRRLIIPRGDTGTFTVPALSPGQSDSVGVFTIFDPITKTRVFQKQVELQDGVFNIEFDHGDTVNLQAGDYLWDIKFYVNPIIENGKVIDGTEIDSYYAAFQTPKCEIRETGDDFMVIDGQPAKIEDLNIILAATSAANAAKVAATEQAEIAATKASEAAERLEQMIAAIPTKVSELENDSGYLQEETDPTVPAWAKAAEKPTYTAQEVGALPSDTFIPSKVSDLTDDSGHYTKPANGIPASDLEETYLTQHQDISMKANSADLAAVATSGSYEDLSNKPTIPEVPVQDVQVNGSSILNNGIANIPKASMFTLGTVAVMDHQYGLSMSSSGQIMISTALADTVKNGTHSFAPITPAYQHQSVFYGLAKAAGDTTQSQSDNAIGTYTDGAKTAIQQMLDVPSTAAIPTQVSELENDAGYLTSFTETDPTVPAWAKAAQKPSYTAAEVGAPTVAEMNTAIGNAIGNINSFDMAVVQELPMQDISTHTIYLVPKTGETNDVYDEYVYINSAWEMVGNTQVDLSNYVQFDDYAKKNKAGVIKVNPNYGLVMQDGTISIRSSTDGDIKAGTTASTTVTPQKQHLSVFYGLAKAAGDTTQSQSDNMVGTYTTEAKAAIRSMIGAAASADLTVQDVQVNGTSILENGVAKVPVAGSTLGVVIGDMNRGVVVLSDGRLALRVAPDIAIKAGINQYLPIVSSTQHRSAFYGLAKAAGDTTQSQSNNSVGSYTNTAKGAIQKMLGVSDLIATEENNLIASKAYAIGDVFTANGKLYKATAAIAADGAIITDGASANCEETSVGEGFVKFTDIASTSVPGAVMVDADYGTEIANKRIKIVKAAADQVKLGTHVSRPITPYSQHESTFYGLAKAAGADEKDSTLPVGQYTDNAKAAIRTMLGATSSNVITVQDTQPTDTDTKIWLPETAPEGIDVPTMADMNAALAGKVGDVQVNGASIITNGVANIPIATQTTFGVTKGYGNLGINIDAQGNVSLAVADASKVKAGTSNGSAIPPSMQHVAAFYGLAKAAGDTTQSASDNAVGTYTYEAQVAIRNMLGVPSYPMANSIKLGNANTIIVPTSMQHEAVFYGLSKVAGVDLANETVTLGTYPETSKTAIRSLIGAGEPLDVQVNGTSVVSNGVANIPLADTSTAGAIQLMANGGLNLNSQHLLFLSTAGENDIKAGTGYYKPITSNTQHISAFYALAKAAGDTTQSASSNAVGTYTDNAKASIKAMLGIQDGSTGTVDITSTTPTITAVENTRYVCGEVTSLSFTPPASGISIVRFTSGSTVTVLTIPSTVKFPEWFDPTSLETNTIYEICVTDGVYGAVMSWAL